MVEVPSRKRQFSRCSGGTPRRPQLQGPRCLATSSPHGGCGRHQTLLRDPVGGRGAFPRAAFLVALNACEGLEAADLHVGNLFDGDALEVLLSLWAAKPDSSM